MDESNCLWPSHRSSIRLPSLEPEMLSDTPLTRPAPLSETVPPGDRCDNVASERAGCPSASEHDVIKTVDLQNVD